MKKFALILFCLVPFCFFSQDAIIQNTHTITVDVDPTGGKLVQTSDNNITGVYEQPQANSGKIVGKDQFKLLLKVADNYSFTNNIKNPAIKVLIDPADAKDGYITPSLVAASISYTFPL